VYHLEPAWGAISALPADRIVLLAPVGDGS
jgi:hypothetical protein